MSSTIGSSIKRAAEAHALGRLDEAQKSLKMVLDEDPENLQALLLNGVIKAKKDECREAISFFARVERQDPTSVQARLWLSICYRRIGHPGALEAASEAAKLSPRDPMVLNQLGLCLLDAQRFTEARGAFSAALSSSPGTGHLHYGLGLAERGLGNSPGAIFAFRSAVRRSKKNLALLKLVRQALMDELDTDGALECAQAICDLEPNSPEANLWLARALIDCGRARDATSLIEKAVTLGSENALASTLLGSLSQINGNEGSAEAYFRKSIELDPQQGSAYLGLVTSRRMTAEDQPLIDQMLGLASDLPNPHHRGQLFYALGKAEEDLGRYEQAMSHFDAANQLTCSTRFGGRKFDRNSLSESYSTAMRIFDKSRMRVVSQGDSNAARPIFVVGMMRSGTTLVEQILSSHSQVSAGGEQRFWSDQRNAAFDPSGNVDPRKVRELSSMYEQVLLRIDPVSGHVVDKMPVNYEVLGLIHLAFPGAKIIHTKRNPADTAISIYTTPNRSRLEWTHDKADIVFMFRKYEELMRHWKGVLPPGVIMDVHYEQLVEDQERVTREILAFCHLQWEDACLHPERNKRAVVTPSVWQVRQPMYGSSMNRWKRYESVLGDFRDLLG